MVSRKKVQMPSKKVNSLDIHKLKAVMLAQPNSPSGSNFLMIGILYLGVKKKRKKNIPEGRNVLVKGGLNSCEKD